MKPGVRKFNSLTKGVKVELKFRGRELDLRDCNPYHHSQIKIKAESEA